MRPLPSEELDDFPSDDFPSPTEESQRYLFEQYPRNELVQSNGLYVINPHM